MENITPASMDEIKRWENHPTQEEFLSIPHIKYMRSLHPLLRVYVINDWELIKTLKIN